MDVGGLTSEVDGWGRGTEGEADATEDELGGADDENGSTKDDGDAGVGVGAAPLESCGDWAGRDEVPFVPLFAAPSITLTNVANGGPGMIYGVLGFVYACHTPVLSSAHIHRMKRGSHDVRRRECQGRSHCTPRET